MSMSPAYESSLPCGLGNEHYVDPAMFEAEKRELFFKSWSAIGFADDVAERGALSPLTFLGVPLLLVRDGEGEIRVFQNVCRHRGMILVHEKGVSGQGLIRCPYHSWSYDLSGALRATPHVGGVDRHHHPAVDRKALGLKEIRSHVWRDVVFVNFSADAPAFADWAAALIDRWSAFEGPLFGGGEESSFQLEVRANWKLAVENYCESYHLPWVHPELNACSPLREHYGIEGPGGFSGQGSLAYRPTLDEDGRRFEDFAGLDLSGKDERLRSGSEYAALYPNALLGVHRDHAFAMILHPQAPDLTVERVRLHYASEAMRDPSWDAMRASNAKMWRRVFEEDVFVVEGMQRGRNGIFFDGGRLTPAMDGPTRRFHDWAAARMAGRRPHGGAGAQGAGTQGYGAQGYGAQGSGAARDSEGSPPQRSGGDEIRKRREISHSRNGA